jgi:hypothetical protein
VLGQPLAGWTAIVAEMPTALQAYILLDAELWYFKLAYDDVGTASRAPRSGSSSVCPKMSMV